MEVPLHNDHGAWVLVPGRLYLASTHEWTETRGFVPSIDGRSSLGRLGLFCHITAGRGDNGFKGEWTLELVAVEPLLLYPRQRIAQLTFYTLEGEHAFYGETGNTSGRYQGDRGPIPIRCDQRK
jgi:dCTP deaminase